jgi:phytoene synthase
MASFSVIRQSLGDTTHGRPVRGPARQPPVDIDAAYDLCEQITRAEARNFYWAVEPLPAYRRRALCAIYAFALRVEGAADASLHRTHKVWLLAQARAGIPHDGTPRPVDPVLVALRDVKRRFPIPLTSLDDLTDGVESDVRGVTYETFEDLVHYSRQVAGSIVRLSVAVLGSRDPRTAARLADDLGVAMQLTNILRDLVEDSGRGLLYIPREDLARFGGPAGPVSASPELLISVIRHGTHRNREWYDRGLSLLPLLDERSAACIAAMARIHTSILDRIERSPDDFLRARITATALTTLKGSSLRQPQEGVSSWRG